MYGSALFCSKVKCKVLQCIDCSAGISFVEVRPHLVSRRGLGGERGRGGRRRVGEVLADIVYRVAERADLFGISKVERGGG